MKRRAAAVGMLLAPGGSPPTIPDDVTMSESLTFADVHGLVPALWSSLSQRGLVQSAPASLRHHVAGRSAATGNWRLAAEDAHVANLARVDDLVEQAVTLLGALDTAGVKAAPLKGIDAVLGGRYPDRGARTMTDIDVLVDDVETAARLIGELGYQPVVGVEPSMHQLPPMVRPGRPGSIELHRALSTDRHAEVLDATAVLDTATPQSDGTGWRLQRTDSVTHLIVHTQLQDEAHLLWRLPLRALHETALAIAGDEPIDWDEVDRRFVSAGRRQALQSHLSLTSTLFGVDPPLDLSIRAKSHARAALALDEYPGLHHRVEQIRYAPRALSAQRMHALYGATGVGATTHARLVHIVRAVRRSGVDERPKSPRRRG